MKKVLLSLATVALAVAANAQTQAIKAKNQPTASNKGFEFKFMGTEGSNCIPTSAFNKTAPIDSVGNTNSVFGEFYGANRKGVKTGFLAAKDTLSPNFVMLRFDGTQGYLKTDLTNTGTYNSTDAMYNLRFPLDDCGYGSKEINLKDSLSRNIEITVENASDSAKLSVILVSGTGDYILDKTPAAPKDYIDNASERATWNLPKGKSVLYGYLTRKAWNGVKDLSAVAGLSFIVEKNKALDLTISNIKVGDAAPATAPKGSLRTIQAGDGFTGLSNDVVANISLTVAPNPASEKATISYASQAGKSVSVVLSNGVSTVATIAGGESSTEINVAGLAAGLYYASVYVDGAYASTSKVLVK